MLKPNLEKKEIKTIYPLPHVPLQAIKPPSKPREIIKIENKKFEIIECLGKGGQGTVYLGYDTVKKEYVAIKRKTHLKKKKILNFEEYYILKKLNLTKERELKYNNSEIHEYIVMEYIKGISLLHSNNKQYHIPFKRKIKHAIESIKHVEMLHQKGIIHGDIKPEHLLIYAGNAQLIDFGFSKEIKDSKEIEVKKGRGTIDYMAPETQFEGILSQKSDIFMLGKTLAAIFKLLGDIEELTSNGDRVSKIKMYESFIAYSVHHEYAPRKFLQEIFDWLKTMTSLKPESRPSLAESRIFFEELYNKLDKNIEDKEIKIFDEKTIPKNLSSEFINELKQYNYIYLAHEKKESKSECKLFASKLAEQKIYYTEITKQEDEKIEVSVKKTIQKAIHYEPCGIVFIEDFLAGKLSISDLRAYDFVCLADTTDNYNKEDYKNVIEQLTNHDIDVIGQFVDPTTTRSQLIDTIKTCVAKPIPTFVTNFGLFAKPSENTAVVKRNCSECLIL